MLWSSLFLRRSVNLADSDVLQTLAGCSQTLVALVSQHDACATNCPSDLLVEIQRVKVLLRCRFLLHPGPAFVSCFVESCRRDRLPNLRHRSET